VTVVSDLAGQSNILVKARELGFEFQKGAPEVAKILQAVKNLESEGYEFEAAKPPLNCSFRKRLAAPAALRIEGVSLFLSAQRRSALEQVRGHRSKSSSMERRNTPWRKATAR
jgi:isopropylmalate/homocitrate/citramalate synthase